MLVTSVATLLINVTPGLLICEEIYSPTFPGAALSFVVVPGYCPCTPARSAPTIPRKVGMPAVPEGEAKNSFSDCVLKLFPSRKFHSGNSNPPAP